MTSSVVQNFADLIQTLPALDDFPEASRESANKLNDVKLNLDMVQVFETYFIATMEEVERHKQIAHEAEILRAAQEQAAADEKEKKEKGEDMSDQDDGKTDGKTDGDTDGDNLGKNADGDFTPPKKKTKTKRKTTTPKKAAKPKVEVFKNPAMILDNQQKKNLGEFLLDVLPIEYVYSVMKLLGDCVLDNRRERENRLAKIVEREEKKKAKRKEKKDQTKMLEENLGIGAGDDVGDEGDAGSTGKPGGPMPPPRAPTSIENPENPAPQNKDADGEEVVTVTPMAAPADSNAMPPPEMTPGEKTDKNDIESKTENLNLNPDAKKPRKLIETPKSLAGVDPSDPDASFPDLDAIKKSDVPILQDLDDQQLLEEMMKLDSVRPVGPVIHGARKRKGSGGAAGSRASARSRAKPIRYKDPESEDDFFDSDEDSIDEFLTEIDTAGEEDDVGRLGQLLGGRKKRLTRGKKEPTEANERTYLHIKLLWNVQPQDFIH